MAGDDYDTRARMIEDVMKKADDDNARSAMQALADTCRKLFQREWLDARDDKVRRVLLAVEPDLLTIDYSPVMTYFYEHGLQRVAYDSDRDDFVFTFKELTALRFSCYNRAWSHPIALPRSKTIMLPPLPEGATHWIVGEAGQSRPRAEIPPYRFAGPTGAVSAYSSGNTPDHCDHCQQDFWHPPFNFLSNCPLCGAPGSFFQSNNGQQVQPTASPIPPRTPPVIGNSSGGNPVSISMRCPGGCGSELTNVYPASSEPGCQDPFRSPCQYRCKVTVADWNKKLEAAKKK